MAVELGEVEALTVPAGFSRGGHGVAANELLHGRQRHIKYFATGGTITAVSSKGREMGRGEGLTGRRDVLVLNKREPKTTQACPPGKALRALTVPAQQRNGEGVWRRDQPYSVETRVHGKGITYIRLTTRSRSEFSLHCIQTPLRYSHIIRALCVSFVSLSPSVCLSLYPCLSASLPLTQSAYKRTRS